jgi:hypothetical protein
MVTCHDRNVSFLVIDTLLDTGRTAVGSPSFRRDASCIEWHTTYEEGTIRVWTFWCGFLYLQVPFLTLHDIPKNFVMLLYLSCSIDILVVAR